MSDKDNKEFVRSIEKATVMIVADTVKNMELACVTVEADAKKECPVDIGILRASMTHEVSLTGEKITGTVANTAEHAPYVHNGTGIYAKDGNGRKTPWLYEAKSGKYKGKHLTKGQEPQPFMEKARDKNKSKVAKILGGK